jgi:hypothetical protein
MSSEVKRVQKFASQANHKSHRINDDDRACAK